MQTVICDSIIGLECAESESESPGLESSTPKSMDLSTLSDQSIISMRCKIETPKLLQNRKYFLPFASVCPKLIEMDENVINKCVYKSSMNTRDHFRQRMNAPGTL